ncbi:MAG: hypothetical protein M3R51_09460 [Candidatus Eremiobacteraeota bacterium]|nr:hypothetical protein [Candidatus Eremiobacteraeota bacterium]
MRQGDEAAASAFPAAMTVLRGRGTGLEVVLAGRDFDEALSDLTARLASRPNFYSGTRATAIFGSDAASSERVHTLRATLAAAGIDLRALSGAPELEAVALESGMDFIPQAVASEELARRRAMRPKRDLKLSDAARSLVADFAGARTDIAQRRKMGETSVRRSAPPAQDPPLAPEPEAGPAAATLYHVGTLRGGQSLHSFGSLIVVGDVNPGTELVAGGDVVVFGTLLGVAHAGAQGDAGARVYAIGLDATQLRIATCIATNEGARAAAAQPEVAMVVDGKIVIVPFEKA